MRYRIYPCAHTGSREPNPLGACAPPIHFGCVRRRRLHVRGEERNKPAHSRCGARGARAANVGPAKTARRLHDLVALIGGRDEIAPIDDQSFAIKAGEIIARAGATERYPIAARHRASIGKPKAERRSLG